MMPIIRRRRYPLLPAEPPQTVPISQGSAAVPPAGSRTVPAPDSVSALPRYPPPKTENRSDSGQFWTDSKPGAPAAGRACSPSAPPEPQSSTPDPQPLWSPQPNEPAADYQIFAAWLQLPAPRHLRQTAVTLGCSACRLRRLSARHHWRTRAAAFDRQRANAASLALDLLLRDEVLDLKTRAERFRLHEWLLHEEVLQAASSAARELRKHPARASLNDVVKLYELAFVLGRAACGMPLAPAPAVPPEPPFSRPDIEAALRKIYGPDEPAESAGTPGPQSG